VHVNVVPPVSARTSTRAQPVDDTIDDSGSQIHQSTLTSLVYHPVSLSAPDTNGMICGGVVSV